MTTISPGMSCSFPGPPVGTPFDRKLNLMPSSVKPLMSPRSHSTFPERILSITSEFTMGVSVKSPECAGARSSRSR
jgi:hypothetical protein